MIAANAAKRERAEDLRSNLGYPLAARRHCNPHGRPRRSPKTQGEVGSLYLDRDAWTRRAILNVAHSVKFSSDRTILQYANDIWAAHPCHVD